MVQDALRAPDREQVATSSRASTILLPLTALVVVIAGWWLIAEFVTAQTVILPTPPQVVAGFTEYGDALPKAAGSTIISAMLGFLVAMVVGIAIGTAIAAWKPIERAFAPLLVALNAVPKVTFAPLLLVWLGYGRTPILWMSFLIAFFPVVLATATGLSSTPAELIELARSLDASRLQTFRAFRVPAALPQLFVGLKVAMPLAVIGVSVGEMHYGQDDLGSFIVQTAGQADTAASFAGIVIYAVIGIAAYYLVVLVEKLALPWQKATTA